MADMIAILLILVLVSCALGFIIREKKKGRVCIGCPSKGTCTKRSCHASQDKSGQY